MGGRALDGLHDIGRAPCGAAGDEEMDMVDMAFHGEDLKPVLFTGLPGQLFKAILNTADQEDLSSVPRAENEMIPYERDGCFCV